MKPVRTIDVDEELYRIICWMKRDSLTNKAIRAYAKSFIGPSVLEPIEDQSTTPE